MTEDEEEDPLHVDEDEEAIRPWSPDFDWLTSHVAVGACFPSDRAAHLAETHGIKAVVDLRAEDCDDEAALRRAGIDLLHLPTPDLEPASLENLELGVRFVRDHVLRGDKVLIHCQHGIGRSALLALCVLVDDGWQPVDALLHAKDQREAVSPSQSQYEGWRAWLSERGIEPPDYHLFGCIAYRHLANG